jgi:hypothetical protein
MIGNLLSFAAGVVLGMFIIWLYDKLLIISCRIERLEGRTCSTSRTNIQGDTDTDELDDNNVKGGIGFKGAHT